MSCKPLSCTLFQAPKKAVIIFHYLWHKYEWNSCRLWQAVYFQFCFFPSENSFQVPSQFETSNEFHLNHNIYLPVSLLRLIAEGWQNHSRPWKHLCPCLRDQTNLIKYFPRLLELLNNKYQRRHLSWNKECRRENHHKAELWDSVCLSFTKTVFILAFAKKLLFSLHLFELQSYQWGIWEFMWLAEKYSTAAFPVDLQNLIPGISYFFEKSPKG